MVKLIQPSFAQGEVSPPVGARVDLAARQVAVELAENFITSYTGSLFSRPGQKFVARCKQTAGDHRIVEFEASRTVTYVLELGEQYMRFHNSGQTVLDDSASATISDITQANPGVVTATAHGFSDGDEVYLENIGGMTELSTRMVIVANSTTNTFELTDLDGNNIDTSGYTTYTSGGTAKPPLELSTPWAAEDLFDLTYAQSAGTMTFCHPDYEPRELTLSGSTFTLAVIDFTPVVNDPTNIVAGSNLTFTANTISGITQANPAVVTTSAAHGLSTGDFVRIDDVVGMIEVNNFDFEITVTSSTSFSLQDPVDGSDIDSTGYTAYSSGGDMILHNRPRFYKVTTVSNDDEESLAGTGRTLGITGITQADPAVVTVDDGHGLDDYEEIEISGISGMTELNGYRFRAIPVTPTTFQLLNLSNENIDSTGFTAYTSGGTVATGHYDVVQSADTGWDNTIAWDAVADAQYYNIYATTAGTYGYIGSSATNYFKDDTIEPDYSVSPPEARNPFLDLEGAGGTYPSAVGYYNQRRIFANTADDPNHL